MEQMQPRYNHLDTEDRLYAYWEAHGLFKGRLQEGREPFTIVIPPPNVTGILHMGHALNNTLQDILIRYQRMNGCAALWMPGTDHAGIATQNVVEKALAKQNLRRQDLGREEFLKRVWEWKEQYGSTIIRQLKKLGASCDWERRRFTMDEEYSGAVREVFVRLYEKGLIYRGSYIINWCPRCQTALADEEAPHQELKASLYYLRYPFAGSPGEHLVVATTRPETMLGDTAVAVNPKDKRYKKFVGRKLLLPLMGRPIPVIADAHVDPAFGTGAVKVTPAHDPNDYQMGKKHGLDFVNVMGPDGRMNEEAGPYRSLDRFKARDQIVLDLQAQGLLEKIEPHHLSAGHCYRCHTIIEPYLSKQWFVNMKPLAKPALEAVKKGRIVFYPKRWTKVYLNWMENIQDWCISRQIWWGHRLPVYYCAACQEAASPADLTSAGSKGGTHEPGVIVSREPPQSCPRCGSSKLVQEEDVLDTWFSSWLWPFATFFWPSFALPGSSGTEASQQARRELEYFYPTAVLVTAPEIIFFWVARMIMAGYEFMGKEPFGAVYIHGTVRDIDGKKMSKSLGNVIDPLDIIKEYGTDALRFSLIAITAQGQDVFLSRERFEQGRNFANKIWNAARFVLMSLDPAEPAHDAAEYLKDGSLTVPDRWILSRLHGMLKGTVRKLGSYKFNEAANGLYAFFWHEFCDWYLELSKSSLQRPQTRAVMVHVLEHFLCALHPFMPFITEEIWQRLREAAGKKDREESIMSRPWPKAQERFADRDAERDMALLIEAIVALRTVRAELDIAAQAPLEVILCAADEDTRRRLQSVSSALQLLARVGRLDIETRYERIAGSFTSVLPDMQVVVLLSGVVDIEKQKEKVRVKLREVEAGIRAKENTLSNQQFLKNAPAEIVEKERAKLAELGLTLEKIKAVRDGIE